MNSKLSQWQSGISAAIFQGGPGSTPARVKKIHQSIQKEKDDHSRKIHSD